MPCAFFDQTCHRLIQLEEALQQLVSVTKELTEPTSADWIAAGATALTALIALITIFANWKAKRRSDAARIRSDSEKDLAIIKTVEATNAENTFEQLSEELLTSAPGLSELKRKWDNRPIIEIEEHNGRHRIVNNGKGTAIDFKFSGARFEDVEVLRMFTTYRLDEMGPGEFLEFDVKLDPKRQSTVAIRASWRLVDGEERRERFFIIS